MVGAIFLLLLWATHAAYMGRLLLAAACVIATLLAAPLVWRHRRVWRELDLSRETDREVIAAVQAHLAAHLRACEADDQDMVAALERELWEVADPAQLSAEASSVRARTPSLA